MTEENDVPLDDTEVTDLPETEESDTQETQQENEKFVPYGALHEERKKRQALQAQLEEYEVWKSTAQERLDKLSEAQTQPEIVPDFEEDPVAHLSYKVDKIYSQTEQQAKTAQEREQQHQQQLQRQQIAQQYQMQAQEFAKRQPDFADGYRHFVQSWQEELAMMGYPPAMASEVIQNEEARIVQHASRTGENAAELVYNLAKRRGYKPTGASIETLKEGQRAAKTMGGGKPEGKLTLQALAEMDPDDFSKLSGDDFRKVMG